jgi:plastocyanin
MFCRFRKFLNPAAAVAAIALSTTLVAAQASPSPSPTVTPTPGTTITISTGNGETGYDVDLFLPSTFTVLTGTTVTWAPSGTWPEPHTVIFGKPQGNPTMPVGLPAAGPVIYDGTQNFSSGTINAADEGTPPFARSFSVKFTKAGAFQFACAYHANMTGTVTVVDTGSADTQSAATARGLTQYQQALAQVKSAAAGLTAPAATTNADGTKNYSVVVGKDAPGGVAVQFWAPTVNVNVGDSVTWMNPSSVTPHTVTFNPQLFQGDPTAPVAPVTAPFDGTGLVNSGLIGFSPAGPVPASFKLVFTKAGSYQYACLLHDGEGMLGTVNVAAAPAAPAATAAPRPPSTGTGGDTGTGLATPLAVAAGTLLIVAGSLLGLVSGARRRRGSGTAV